MYITIFDDIVSVLHKDYAGCLDKVGWDNPDFYRNEIKKRQEQGKITDQKFAELVQDYLLDFKDLHMHFKYAVNSRENNITDAGFVVRRYKDALYVVATGKENRLNPGDVILKLDGRTVSELAEFHQRQLRESEPERENWTAIVPLYKTMEIKDKEGNAFLLEIKKYEKEQHHGEYSLKEIEEGTLIINSTFAH
ncbi:hypothetical protein [Gracilibacillus salinarum]|uniref:PDZ domain-containing protein n=1 Tax=Gracilibacillus salinarum TaxID=2932255 RepID=A0ABY4GMF7_9BACI|nr:hypothetical protein [Gracilibacillus salinarum]UOQ84932.1 hypothetical protein MUN87_20150 [Gracilibacillus salinarum]